MSTLRDAQVAALTSLLTLNQPPAANGSSAVAPIPTWKVLIMDKIAQDVMATSLRVQDLRDQGVTLHMSVSSRPGVRRAWGSQSGSESGGWLLQGRVLAFGVALWQLWTGGSLDDWDEMPHLN